MTTGPEEGAAAGYGSLRASHADREQVIDMLKTAFADGRLPVARAELRVLARPDFRTAAGRAHHLGSLRKLAAASAAAPAASSRKLAMASRHGSGTLTAI